MFSKMWGFTARNKIKTALLFFSVLCLVLLTNLQERRMIKRINETVTSIYEDRVVVGNYILKLSNYTEEILLSISSNKADKHQRINSILHEIDSLNGLYDKTYLTDNEQNNFNKFKDYCKEILSNNNLQNDAGILQSTTEAEQVLKILSSIQVEEGKVKLDEIMSMTHTSSLLSYIEIIVIIIISILIQALVLSAKPLIMKKINESQHRMN